MRSLLIVALLAGAAAAQPIHSDAEQLEVAKIRMSAEQAEKDQDYHRCAAIYRDLYQKIPDLAGEEVLFDAMQCANLAGLSGDAIRAAEELVTSYPQSPLAGRALWVSGHAHADLGEFAAAAEKLETAAKLYAGERESPVALLEAARFRGGLGQLAEMRFDVEMYVKGYAAKRPGEAARAMLGVALLEADRAKKPPQLRAAEAELGDWLKEFTRADPALQAVAHEALGKLLWRRSCASPGLDGLCVTQASKLLPSACDVPRAAPLTVKKRDAKLAGEARKHLKMAIELGRRLTNEGTDGIHAMIQAAEAERLLGDADFEALLALPPPAIPKPRAQSGVLTNTAEKVVQTWTTALLAAARKAEESYRTGLTAAGPFGALPAAARIGQVYEAFARQTVGPFLRLSPLQLAAMCPTVQPALERTREAFQACLKLAADTGTFDSWTALCQRELESLSPGERGSHEITPAPRAPMSIAAAPPVRESPAP